MTPSEIQKCVKRAATAIKAHCGKTRISGDKNDLLIDLLTDLIHWSDSAGVNFDSCVGVASYLSREERPNK